jgi:hypothetical protein
VPLESGDGQGKRIDGVDGSAENGGRIGLETIEAVVQ